MSIITRLLSSAARYPGCLIYSLLAAGSSGWAMSLTLFDSFVDDPMPRQIALVNGVTGRQRLLVHGAETVAVEKGAQLVSSSCTCSTVFGHHSVQARSRSDSATLPPSIVST
jgi:hypothetical protein